MKYARINSTGGLDVVVDPNLNESLIKAIIADGFISYECEAIPNDDELDAIESYKLCYRQEEDRIIGYYEKVAVDPEKVEAEIGRLKTELATTDYQVVKNQELQMVGQACAYDPQVLYNVREPLREAIRELEGYLDRKSVV